MNTLNTSEQCINNLKSTFCKKDVAQQCLQGRHLGGSQPTQPLFSVCQVNEYQRAMARMELAYLMTLDDQGCLADANPALCRALGTCLEEMLGIHFEDMVFPSDRQEVIRALQSLEFPQAKAQGVHRWNAPNGALWVEWEAIATHDSDGTLKTVQIFAHDISEYKTLQAELEQRLRETQALADINRHLNETLEPKLILDLIVGYAQSLIQPVERVVLHRYDADKQMLLPVACAGLLESEPTTLMMSPGLGIAGKAFAQRCLINVGDTSHDSRYLPGPGPQRFYSLMAAPIQSEAQILGTISVQSRQPHAFQAECERVLSELCDSAAIALKNAIKFEHEQVQRQVLETFTDLDYSIYLAVNLEQVLEQILDFVLNSGLACSANIMLIQGDQAVVLHHAGYSYSPSAEQVLKNVHFSLDTTHFRQLMESGNVVWVDDMQEDPLWQLFPGTQPLKVRSYASAPLKVQERVIGFLNADSTQPGAFNRETALLLGFVAGHAAIAIQNARLYEGLVQKAEEEHQARQRLAQSEKLAALGRMVSAVVHEINNPLQSIQNCLYILEEERATVPDASGFFKVALSEVERLSDLVSHLRELHKGGQITRVAPVNLGSLLDKIHALVTIQLEHKRVNWVQGDFPPETLVLADANQLTQVFLNLILNAIEAMSVQGGTITLELQTLDYENEIGLRIADSGPGIDPRLAKNIFDPFFTTKSTGTGMGLAVCYEIIRNHNGRITLDSHLGAGAAFTVWLPSAEPEGGI